MNPKRFRRIKKVLEARQPDLTVLMERVNKSHNFSAILRNCDAVGVLKAHAVLPDGDLDLHHHTSAGTTRWLQVEVHQNIRHAVERLHQDGFLVLAAHPSDSAVDYRAADLARPVAIMVGAELDGLSPEGIALADETVRIPMGGMVRSLNVSVATALLLFEAFRQREELGVYRSSRLPPEELKNLLFEWAYPDIATVLRKRGNPYPILSEDGEILG